jgi:hypothetical protein
LPPGHDVGGTISFGILDSEKQLVALGQAKDNIDEGKASYLDGTLKIKYRDFDRVFADGQKPTLRVTLRVDDP